MEFKTRIFLAAVAGVAALHVWLIVDAMSSAYVSVPLLIKIWPLLGQPGSPNFLLFLAAVSVASAAIVGVGFGYLLSRLIPRPRWVGALAFVTVANAYLLVDAIRSDLLPAAELLAVTYSQPGLWALFAAAVVGALQIRRGVEQQPGA